MRKHFAPSLLVLALVLALAAYKLLPQQTRTVEYIDMPRPTHALTAYKDPVTGRFTLPNREQLAAQTTKRESISARKIHLPDGSTMLDLRNHYRPARARQ